ncbi:hypothetical protein PFICI_13536 [Pestalotiopsis fici W106-1]|uniref:Ecp2 effector protein-like domain-containing protein n=1 Tax=Pestalotiopsis fici (strain W106-1 / CGMCC3.15140) TaxID=1229662 RepID=W3WPG9_PESFW|nr:uncharacterized protein PFICI_13536 [Pestalotiopsis fici W106-1]ETS75052.1 hypothetical protein PFICI_13536 [Pestalotiopsis fici W106-1]
MKFTSLTIGCLAAIAIADSICAGDKYDQGYCQITSVETIDDADITRTIADCERLCENIADHDGDWHVDLTGTSNNVTLININHCRLKLAWSMDQDDLPEFRVAKQDILDLVDGAIIFAEAEGVDWVFLKGNMTCDGKDVSWWVA